ncbi:MAG TPA: HDOD domain-containing protein, partial [Chitinivibrionales bacterium]
AKKQVRASVERITNLPTLPAIVGRVLRIVNNPESCAKDLAAAVEQDVTLSAKILRLANSAFYGIPKTVTSINGAVVILGFKVIRTIVLSLTVFDMFPGDSKSPLFNRTAFWRHCTSCALIARSLARRLTGVYPFDAEEAFCAGLLHDIGKVVMEQYIHEEFHGALRHAKTASLSPYQAEMEKLGYAHTDVAQWLTQRWDLPAALHIPMVFHHDPLAAPQCGAMAALCHFADHVCYDLKLTIDESYTAPPVHAEVARKLGISEDDIESVKLQLVNELDKVDLFCGVAAAA